jgi:phosphoribosylpyrophosphate synthetase
MAKSEEIVLLCGGGRTNRLAGQIIEVVNSRRIGQTPLKLSHTDFGWFSDGEPDHAFNSWEEIRDKHVVLFLSTHNMELVLELLILIRAIKKRYGAKSLTVVLPFMAFRRQDHPEIDAEFDLNLWFIENIKQNGADRLVVCDIHSKRTLENCQAVGLEAHHVKPTPLYAAALTDTVTQATELGKKLKVISPDKGSLLRCIALAKMIKASVVVSLKKRSETGNIVTKVEPSPEETRMIEGLAAEHGVSIELISEEVVKDVICILREDELDTGGTASYTCRDLMRAGAHRVELVVTHMKCSPTWKRKIVRKSPFHRIYGGDTIYREYQDRTGGLVVDIFTDVIIAETLAEVLDSLE